MELATTVNSNNNNHSEGDEHICSNCAEVKPASEFYARKGGGVMSWCKKCHNLPAAKRHEVRAAAGLGPPRHAGAPYSIHPRRQAPQRVDTRRNHHARKRDMPAPLLALKEQGVTAIHFGLDSRPAAPIDGSVVTPVVGPASAPARSPAPAPAPAPVVSAGSKITLRQWIRANGGEMRAYVCVLEGRVRLMVEQLPDKGYPEGCVYRVWFTQRERRRLRGSATMIEGVIDYVLPELLDAEGVVLFPGTKAPHDQQ